MATSDRRLVLTGGTADLGFRDGSGAKRRVLTGVPFDVDEATAAILLATDANIAEVLETVSRETSEGEPTGLAAFALLRARAKALGLSAKGKADELTTAIAAEEARLEAERVAAEAAAAAEAANQDDQTDEGDPDDSATPPAGAPGAITLGGLPPSAVVGEQA